MLYVTDCYICACGGENMKLKTKFLLVMGSVCILFALIGILQQKKDEYIPAIENETLPENETA